LLGHKVNDAVTLNSDHSTGRFEIVSIEAAPVDTPAADPDLLEIASGD